MPIASQGVLITLATANKRLPHLMYKNVIGEKWFEQVQELSLERGPHTCTPDDLSRAMTRLSQMPALDAVKLVNHIVEIWSKASSRKSWLE